jgi:hypothetical protein
VAGDTVAKAGLTAQRKTAKLTPRWQQIAPFTAATPAHGHQAWAGCKKSEKRRRRFEIPAEGRGTGRCARMMRAKQIVAIAGVILPATPTPPAPLPHEATGDGNEPD